MGNELYLRSSCHGLAARGFLKKNPRRNFFKMMKMSFLDFQYNLSKRKYLRRPTRQPSGPLLPSFQPDSEELRQVFDKFDSNKDGKITQQDYRAILRALGKAGTAGEVRKIFQVVDLDGDGFINFKEFVEAQGRGGGIKKTDIQSAFRTFDLNGDGRISAEEVMEVLRRLGERCGIEECRRMVRAVDTDGDGMINMDEFMAMMTKTMKLQC